jgi:succinate dehydrogenase/fumarate reductase flavoprotein subunit
MKTHNTQLCLAFSHVARDRTQDSLAEGKVKIDEVLSTWQDLKVTDRSLMWNTDLIESLELR